MGRRNKNGQNSESSEDKQSTQHVNVYMYVYIRLTNFMQTRKLASFHVRFPPPPRNRIGARTVRNWTRARARRAHASAIWFTLPRLLWPFPASIKHVFSAGVFPNVFTSLDCTESRLVDATAIKWSVRAAVRTHYHRCYISWVFTRPCRTRIALE